MNEFTDYPLSVFLGALRTVVGRVFLVSVAVVLGAFLGGVTALRSWEGGCWAVSAFYFLFATSIFTSVGIIALPGTLLIACIFARYEWPLWTVFLATLLIWWNTHGAVSWVAYESPMAQMRLMFEKAEQEANQAAEKAKKQEAAQSKGTP
ncbi:MAG: hypothetical protein NT105_14975 [Verrucomicrobia bacterium]|nr:hypothetical protein [Verrucomicrobiota bacterium]